MANGLEDLHEKNKNSSIKIDPRFRNWNTFQGREDAEMLQEKSSTWHSQKNNTQDYSSWDEE